MASYTQSDLAAATQFARQQVEAFKAGPETSFENPTAARPDGRTWVQATGRGGATPQQTV